MCVCNIKHPSVCLSWHIRYRGHCAGRWRSFSVCLPFLLQKREGFCQLLQQMKNKHSEQPEPDMITIFIGTWNMGGSLCPCPPTSFA